MKLRVEDVLIGGGDKVNCVSPPALSVDTDITAETILQGYSAIFAVTGGGSPYTYTLSGTGYSFVEGEDVTTLSTVATTVTIYADATSCGGAIIEVEDVCGSTTDGTIRNPDAGEWTLIYNSRSGVSPDSGDDPYPFYIDTYPDSGVYGPPSANAYIWTKGAYKMTGRVGWLPNKPDCATALATASDSQLAMNYNLLNYTKADQNDYSTPLGTTVAYFRGEQPVYGGYGWGGEMEGRCLYLDDYVPNMEYFLLGMKYEYGYIWACACSGQPGYVAPTWDATTIPETITQDSSIVISIDAGSYPFTYVITGTGYSFSDTTTVTTLQTNFRDVTVYSGETSCGTLTVKVTDNCAGTDTTSDITNTDSSLLPCGTCNSSCRLTHLTLWGPDGACGMSDFNNYTLDDATDCTIGSAVEVMSRADCIAGGGETRGAVASIWYWGGSGWVGLDSRTLGTVRGYGVLLEDKVNWETWADIQSLVSGSSTVTIQAHLNATYPNGCSDICCGTW